MRKPKVSFEWVMVWRCGITGHSHRHKRTAERCIADRRRQKVLAKQREVEREAAIVEWNKSARNPMTLLPTRVRRALQAGGVLSFEAARLLSRRGASFQKMDGIGPSAEKAIHEWLEKCEILEKQSIYKSKRD